MNFKILLSAGMILCSSLLFGQVKDTTYWVSGGFVAATFSQVSLSDSWSAGGTENVAINGATGLFADYKKARSTWENSLDLGYGMINQNNQGFQKSDDKINFVTKYGYRIKEGNANWFFSGLLDFRTQFDEGFTQTEDGRDSLISKFMAPGYLTMGLGIDYKPNPKLSFNYIPLTGKFTFVNDQTLADKGAYGVDPGSKSRAELGSFLRIKYKDEVLKNVNVETRLELFSNYIKDFGTIDVNWQTTVVMKVNKVLSANLFTHLIYDKDIKTQTDEGEEARVQFKSVFGVGLAYNFGAQRAK
ncbi:DUF3078 domain-containing protein [Marinoscillum sp. 108]|uniref:DUF3078 domain-containing protein n=1 Tax=Marinoscillum luteum TaxID=861051 RepID=A0ABW7N333_9BACT|nr:DUF3078 domain-containing protein [Marinoscillum sp. 108]VXD15841.1 conserved exported hypothetical protein [Marinoscillum sp. 108]